MQLTAQQIENETNRLVIDGWINENVLPVPKGDILFVPQYSSRLDAAMTLTEVLSWPRYWWRMFQTNTGRWRVAIELNGDDGPAIEASSFVLAVAICRAALLVKLAETSGLTCVRADGYADDRLPDAELESGAAAAQLGR